MPSNYLQSILDSALDALVTIDESGLIVEFNSVAETTFGRKRRDVVGQPMVELIIPPELRGAHLAGMAKYKETGEGPVLNQRIQITALRANGDVFPIELAIVPLINEGQRLFTATIRDITEMLAREKQLEESMKQEILLRRELDHRVKNNLGQIVVMCRQAMERSTSDQGCIKDLLNRVLAMSTIHDLFGSTSDDGIPLNELVAKGCEPYRHTDEQVSIQGPQLHLKPTTAMTMSVIINELATNAAKYGAFLDEAGSVSITWTHADEQVVFLWSEHVKHDIDTNGSPSFGFQLLNSLIPYELDGSVQHVFGPDGISFTATIPDKCFQGDRA